MSFIKDPKAQVYHLQAPTILFTKPSCSLLATQLLKCCHDNSKSTEPQQKGAKLQVRGSERDETMGEESIYEVPALRPLTPGAGGGVADWGGGQEKQRAEQTDASRKKQLCSTKR